MKLSFVVTKMFVKFADAGKKELINWSIWEKFNNSQLKNNKYQCKAEFLVWRKLTTRVISRHHGREYIAIEMSEFSVLFKLTYFTSSNVTVCTVAVKCLSVIGERGHTSLLKGRDCRMKFRPRFKVNFPQFLCCHFYRYLVLSEFTVLLDISFYIRCDLETWTSTTYWEYKLILLNLL